MGRDTVTPRDPRAAVTARRVVAAESGDGPTLGRSEDRPEFVTIPAVQLVAAGTWNASTGEATITTEDLAAAVSAQQDPAVRKAVLKIGHIDPRFNVEQADGSYDGTPAIGRIDNLRLDGAVLVGDYTGVPAWLAEIIPVAYPSRSIEGLWGFTSATGRTHKFVITAVSLLGETEPAVKGLDDVRSLFYGPDA